MFRESKINYLSVYTGLYLLSSIIYLPLGKFSTGLILFTVFNFIWFGLSSSLYYHRCLTHNTFKLNWFVEMFFLIGGLLGLGGDPIKWAVVHRFHHQNSDKEKDPHSPKHGFFWAYFGWVLHHDDKLIGELKEKLGQDLLKKKRLKNCGSVFAESLPHILYILTIGIFFDINTVFIGIILPCLLSYNFHWMLIASFCHTPGLGYRRFDNLPDMSRNLPWLSFLSFGESMHNNHHKYPNYVNLSSSKFEFDFTYTVVKILLFVGLARDVKRVSYEKK